MLIETVDDTDGEYLRIIFFKQQIKSQRYLQQGVQKFGQTRQSFAVGRDCMQQHFSK